MKYFGSKRKTEENADPLLHGLRDMEKAVLRVLFTLAFTNEVCPQASQVLEHPSRVC